MHARSLKGRDEFMRVHALWKYLQSLQLRNCVLAPKSKKSKNPNIINTCTQERTHDTFGVLRNPCGNTFATIFTYQATVAKCILGASQKKIHTWIKRRHPRTKPLLLFLFLLLHTQKQQLRTHETKSASAKNPNPKKWSREKKKAGHPSIGHTKNDGWWSSKKHTTRAKQNKKTLIQRFQTLVGTLLSLELCPIL